MSPPKKELNRPRKKEALSSEQALINRPDINTGVLSAGLLLISIGIVMNYSTTAALALEHHLPPLSFAAAAAASARSRYTRPRCVSRAARTASRTASGFFAAATSSA